MCAAEQSQIEPRAAGVALVTGGAGFIGSHLVERLLAEGWRVRVLDDFSTGKRGNLPRSDRLTTVEGDIRDATAVRAAMSGSELVFHLASVVGVRRVVADPLNAIRVMVNGTETVFEEACRTGAKVVLTSSSEVYGLNPVLPFREDSDRVLGPTNVSRWSYATAKALDEHLLFAFREQGLRGVVIRYFNTYGPRQDAQGYAGVVATFCNAIANGRPLEIHGDGSQTRCFCYVADSVEANFRAGMLDAAEGRILNVGNDHEITVLELAQLVAEVAGASVSMNTVPFENVFGSGFQDPKRRKPDVSAAEAVLGFRAKTPLRVGLEQTLAWARRVAASQKGN